LKSSKDMGIPFIEYPSRAGDVYVLGEEDGQNDFNAVKIAEHVSHYDGDFLLTIPVNEEDCGGVRVTRVTMRIVRDKDEDEDNYDEDMVVGWELPERDEEEEEEGEDGDLPSGIMADMRLEDRVCRAMQAFGEEGEFTSRLHALLRRAGFSNAAAAEVQPSEWEMQASARCYFFVYLFCVVDSVSPDFGNAICLCVFFPVFLVVTGPFAPGRLESLHPTGGRPRQL
jgi:hypothetical protein